MDIIGQESTVGAIDPENLLSDVNFRILRMIIDRVEFASRQVSFLQILPSWFTEIRKRQQSSDILVDAGIAPLADTFDANRPARTHRPAGDREGRPPRARLDSTH
jgi:hypothetical protein